MKLKEIMCMDCGKFFGVTSTEREKLRKRGKKCPAHCPACRNDRWAKQHQLQKQKEKYRKGNERQYQCYDHMDEEYICHS